MLLLAAAVVERARAPLPLARGVDAAANLHRAYICHRAWEMSGTKRHAAGLCDVHRKKLCKEAMKPTSWGHIVRRPVLPVPLLQWWQRQGLPWAGSQLPWLLVPHLRSLQSGRGEVEGVSAQ